MALCLISKGPTSTHATRTVQGESSLFILVVCPFGIIACRSLNIAFFLTIRKYLITLSLYFNMLRRLEVIFDPKAAAGVSFALMAPPGQEFRRRSPPSGRPRLMLTVWSAGPPQGAVMSHSLLSRKPDLNWRTDRADRLRWGGCGKARTISAGLPRSFRYGL